MPWIPAHGSSPTSNLAHMSVEFEEVSGFLAKHEPFAHLPAEELSGLPAQMSMRYAKRGEYLVHKGEANESLFIIRSGAVDVVSGEGSLLDRRDPGRNCGYSTLLGEPVSHYDMVAVEDSLLLVMPQATFQRLTEQYPDITRFFTTQQRRIRSAAQELADSTAADVLRTSVKELIQADPLAVSPQTSIKDAAIKMTEHRVSSLLITSQDGALHGIVTDRDLRSRVVAAGVDSAQPVAQIMTGDPITLSPESLVMEAIMHMGEQGIHHLPVTRGGAIVGVVTQTDITRRMQDDPIFLSMDLSRRGSVEELEGSFAAATQLAARYIDRGTSPHDAAGLVTIAADTLARRLCAMAEEELGPPPVPYAFVAVGSQGRREMALASDQDNALVLDDGFDEAAHGRYFEELGRFVCEGLDGAGQVLCPGGMMAMSPEWRMTESQWISAFGTWVTAPQPDALLHSQVFFDFRTVYGDEGLGRRVHDAAVAAAKGSRRMHAHLASLAARREPPLTFFKGLVVDRAGEYANTLDVKKGGLAAIVQMARLYALSAGLAAVDTRERLTAAAGETVSREGSQNLLDAFNYLRAVTLNHQSEQVRRGLQPDYHIDPKSLSRMDRENLRDAFQVIKNMQNSLATKYPVRNI